MGRVERRAVIAALAGAAAILFSTAAGADSGGARAEDLPSALAFSAGAPFSGIDLHVPVAAALALGARATLVEAHAVRVGAGARLTWWRDRGLALTVELTGLRAIGLDAASTWDVDLTQELRIAVAEDTAVTLKLGAIGYLGEEPGQRGVVGLAAARLTSDLDDLWRVGVEVGWMADPRIGRPLGALVVERSF